MDKNYQFVVWSLTAYMDFNATIWISDWVAKPLSTIGFLNVFPLFNEKGEI